ncbi:MAG: RidA family protein [Kofleriaceae bacterium]|nr:RidA family protein [Kofleriaceae bacterium]
MSNEDVIVPSWPQPKGYSNGRVCTGRVLHTGGQIGWSFDEGAGGFVFRANDLVSQFAQTLDNVLAVVKAAGGGAEDIASMTVFVTDIPAYRGAQKLLGVVWRERMGRYFPAMALVGVTELVEPQALVEIQAIAYLGDKS